MSDHGTLPDDHPDATLLSLGRQLEEVDVWKESGLDDEAFDAAYEEHC
jgi:hypothetical protein